MEPENGEYAIDLPACGVAVRKSAAMNPVPVAAGRNTKTAVAASRSLRLQTLAGAIAFFSDMRRLVFLLVIGSC